MYYEIRFEQPHTLVTASGPTDRLADEAHLRTDVNKLLEAGMSPVILDFRAITFMPASFVGVLVALSKKAAKHECELAMVVEMGSPCASVIRLCHLDRVLDIYTSVEVCLNDIVGKDQKKARIGLSRTDTIRKP